jgi:FAD dependent oxidoreductase
VEVEAEHYFATFSVTFPSRSQGPLAAAADYERTYSASLECPWSGPEQRFRGADGFLWSGCDRLDLAAWRDRMPVNLRVFGPHAMPGNTRGSLALERLDALFRAFPDPVGQIRAALADLPAGRGGYEFLNRGVPAEEAGGQGWSHHFVDHGFSEPGVRLAEVRFHPPAVAAQSEVLVVGGGTSGNAAAFSSASLGHRTLCVDRALELGGTNTIGGVSKLWYGNKTPAFDEYYRRMGARNDGLNAPGFYRGTIASGARILFHSAVTGVMREAAAVRRVYVITPFGLTAVAAEQVIDASGDGAVAAWAGCGYDFGGVHDELTLWASFAGFRPGNPEAMRPFLSPLDERSAADVTRFIIAMRRNASRNLLSAKHFPPPFFVAPRESRHIRAGRTVTFLDVLAGRRFRDGVLRIESNPDIKGVATSDAAKAGFIPRGWERLFQVTIPYSALVPTGIDNVIVAGKAYSISHDALAAARMQRDLCVMGLVAGEAVSLALKTRVRPRDIEVTTLQATLITKGMLRPSDVAADDLGFGLNLEEAAREVIARRDPDECLAASAMLCLLPRDQVIRRLEPHAAEDHHAVNRVLGFLGSRRATTHVLTAVEQALAAPALSRDLYGGDGNRLSMPDQGYAPWTALRLHLLAVAGDARAIPLLAGLAGRVSCDVAELRSSWGYFYSLACGFERLACIEGQAPLERLLRDPLFQRRTVPRSGDLRACADTTAERLGYLRLALARALTRCGSAAGARILCEFLDEARVCYARAARAELAAAAGRDLGFDADAWRGWIGANANRLAPNPLQASFA